MRRVGIIGIENSHTDHFLRHLNGDQVFADTSVTAILRGEPDRVEKLAGDGRLEVVDEPAELIGVVDAAIVCSRDGGLHREQAEPLLRAGIPVLIDKPLATTATDAQALVEASSASGALLMSASAVRFTPEVATLVAAEQDTGPYTSIAVSGPADPDSPYAGVFFYGIHVVETAFELLGSSRSFDPDQATEQLTVQTGAAVVVATTIINDVVVTLRMVKPDDHGRVPFHAAVFGRHGSVAHDLTLGPDYNLPLLKRFLTALDAGEATADSPGLVLPITVTERIHGLLRTTAAVH